MTKEDLIAMAREAGFETDNGPKVAPSVSVKVGGLYVGVHPMLDRFASLVAARTREECAKVCEAGINNATDWDSSIWDQACQNRAVAILAMGERT